MTTTVNVDGSVAPDFEEVRTLSADPNDRSYLEVEVPAGNGVGTARAIARAYSCFA